MKTIKFLFMFGGLSCLRHRLEFARQGAPRSGCLSGPNWLLFLNVSAVFWGSQDQT